MKYNQSEQRYFIVLEPSETARTKLLQYLECLNSFHIPYEANFDLHLTVLYFSSNRASPGDISELYAPILKKFQPVSFGIKEIYQIGRHVWVTLNKDNDLGTLHSDLVSLAHFGNLHLRNQKLDSWTPHVMIAYDLPRELPEEQRKWASVAQRLLADNPPLLLFDRVYLTKENPNSFEVLFDSGTKFL